MLCHCFGRIQLVTFQDGVASALGVVDTAGAEQVSLFFGNNGGSPRSNVGCPLDSQGRGDNGHLGGGFLLTSKFGFQFGEEL
jgi:hypothetical protein